VHIEAYVGRAARLEMMAVVKVWQKGVALMFPSRIMARRQLSSLQPIGVDPAPGVTVMVTVTKVVPTWVVDVIVEVKDVVCEELEDELEEEEVEEELDDEELLDVIGSVVLGTKQEHALLIPKTAFGEHIEA